MTLKCLKKWVFALIAVFGFGAVLAESATEAVNADTSWFDNPGENVGTAENPYVITTAQELAGLAQLVNAGNNFSGTTIKLGADIDLQNVNWTPIGYNGASFMGVFDGGSKTISNFNAVYGLENTAANNGIGLFGRTEDPAEIKNVTIENATVKGSLYVGAIVGYGFTGKGVVNCHVKGDVKIDAYWYAGVIGGNGYTSPVKDCTVVGSEGSYIKGNGGSYIGGIWGYRGEGGMQIDNCSVTGLAISGVDRVGGISGMVQYGNSISACTVADTTISASNPNCTSVGLIAGANNGTEANPSMVVNNTIGAGASADIAGTAVTTTTGRRSDNSAIQATVVGTGVTFDDNGKVAGGTFEVAPPESAIADDFVIMDNGDGTCSAVQVVTIGSAADFDAFAAAVNYDNPTPSGSDGYYQGVKASWNKNLYVKITADIDMSKVTFTTAIGSYGNGGGFSGTLDGCGHTLSNYTVSGNWNYARALFRQAEDITVKNITFHNFRSEGKKGVFDHKTRPAGVVFASVLGTKNVFENVTVTDSVLYGDNGLGILTGYGSGDYYNTYVTEYTFTNCTISNCTIYSETDRAAILGEFGRDGDVILTISGCTFENNTLKTVNIKGEITATSDLPVWYNHAAAAIERDGVFYTYEHFGYAEEGKDKVVEVNYALKAAKSGDTIILVKDIEVTEDEAETAFAKSVDINKGKTNSTAPAGYAWDTDGNLVKIIARIGDDYYWDLDDAIEAAQAGETVTVLSDNAKWGENFSIPEGVTIVRGEGVTLDAPPRPQVG